MVQKDHSINSPYENQIRRSGPRMKFLQPQLQKLVELSRFNSCFGTNFRCLLPQKLLPVNSDRRVQINAKEIVNIELTKQTERHTEVENLN